MANNKTKTVILIAAAALAVGGVLAYAKTRVEPPVGPDPKDVYAIDMTRRILQNQAPADYEANQRAYGVTDHRARLFAANGRIEDVAYRNFQNSNDSIYAERVVMETFEIFNSPKWNDTRLGFLESQVNRLSSKEGHTITPATIDKMLTAAWVFSNYRDAKRACQVSFTNLADAQSKIAAAGNFKTQPYLCNNRDLRASLDDVTAKLANGHYNKLKQACDRLQNYQASSTWDDYYSLVSAFNSQSDEYLKTDIYGSQKRSIDQLKRAADQYTSWAKSYFFD